MRTGGLPEALRTLREEGDDEDGDEEDEDQDEDDDEDQDEDDPVVEEYLKHQVEYDDSEGGGGGVGGELTSSMEDVDIFLFKLNKTDGEEGRNLSGRRSDKVKKGVL